MSLSRIPGFMASTVTAIQNFFGATDAASARAAIAAAASGANSDITSLTGITTPHTVAQGGTGAATLTGIVKGNGTSAFTAVAAPGGAIVGTTDAQTLTNKTLTAPAIGDATGTTLTLSTGANSSLMLGRDTTVTGRNMVSLNGSLSETAGSGIATGATGDSNLYLCAPTGSQVRMLIGGTNYYNFVSSTFQPNADNAATLGGSSARWSTVYAATGTINTSDARQKTAVAPITGALAFIQSLKPVSFKWIVGGRDPVVTGSTKSDDGETVDTIGYVDRPGKRTHWGLLAQDVKAALDAAGLDTGVYVHDTETDTYGLRMDQMIPVLIKAVQELSAKLDALQPPASSAH